MAAAADYKGDHYPPDITGHAIWLYFRFAVGYRDVGELLAARGVVSYETIGRWCLKFGQAYANGLRRRRRRPGDKWHRDEVFLKINGEAYCRRRAVDQEGHILDILAQSRHYKRAATSYFRTLLKGLDYVLRVIVTDKLASYGAAKREMLPNVEHRQHRYLNNRVENSHQHMRERARRMQRFKSSGHAQRFLAAYREIRDQRFATWHAVTSVPAAACRTAILP